ncbi:DUF6794 domain-containing protein [Dokdonella sp. MW10]|uniref:DUF6794 domain-containing protein n=1 Tax=Dokdonella sp. MW10 TaxID=2992926 RepID=UPI003F7E1F10
MKRIAMALAVLLMASMTRANDDLPPGPDTWPTTVEATVADLLSTLSAENKKKLRDTPKDDLIRFHHGLGTGIRNHYGLWRGNRVLIASACGKPCHPDDASMVIIEALWSALQRDGT